MNGGVVRSRVVKDAREPEVCRRCAGQGPTCCAPTPGDEERRFPVSAMERLRIEEYLGLDRGALTLEPNTAAFRAAMHRLFPGQRAVVEALFPHGGSHARLSTDARGRCVFLRMGGCLLPRQVRPYYCRLFPFWVEDGRVTVLSSADCLARRESHDLAAMFGLFDSVERVARDLHGRLRLAWGLPPKEGMPFVNPSSARFST